MARILARIGGFSARHKWSVLAGWIVVLIVAVGGAATLSKPLDSDFPISGLSSISTLNRIDSEFGLDSGVSGKVVFAAPAGQRLTAADLATVTTLSRRLA